MSNPVAFLNGEYVPLHEAKVGIMTHALHYGTGAFEGIRGNWNPKDKKIYIYKLKIKDMQCLVTLRIERRKYFHLKNLSK